MATKLTAAGHPKTLENAKRQFVELYGSALVMNTYLKIALVLVSLVAVGLVALNFHTVAKYAQVKPLVIRIPQQGLKQKPAMIAGDDFVKLLRQLSQPHRTMVSLIAATGLRVEELLALRWGALDLVVGTLTVRQSVFEGKFQAPKTQRAMRTIPLGPRVVKLLMGHRERIGRRESCDLVFANQRGKPFRESKLLTRVLQPAAVEAGLGRVTWHQFRHIHSSLMSDLNVPMKIAQEQLGHVSLSTTLNVYTHVVEASHRSAVEAVEDRLFVESVSNCLESATRLETAIPASASVNSV